VPQAPQLFESVLASTQVPFCAGHCVRPEPQTHRPELQVEPVPPQALSHSPQLLGSVASNAQPVVQVTCDVGQVHTPASQLAPGLQTFPQLPQLNSSVARSTQAPPQVSGVAVGHEQTPLAQTPCVAHFEPQAPQCVASVLRSTHASLQAVLSQWHAPFAQVSPGKQLWPHAPQFAVSVLLLTHLSLHVSGTEPGHAHCPLAQVAPLAHAVAQAPQCVASV
jgi:hypothetical protein